jgi:diaminohydroxyphosphoribosylaminopyrimidine deaminase/5-amino-6-(5-phosphoribosylamino)uracil reductase
VRARDPQRTVLLVARDADQRRVSRLRSAGVLVATVPRAAGGLDLERALRWLAEQGVNTVLSEAGTRVSAGLLRAGLADRAFFIVSPLLGGSGPQLAGIAEPHQLRDPASRRLGEDVAIEGYLR